MNSYWKLYIKVFKNKDILKMCIRLVVDISIISILYGNSTHVYLHNIYVISSKIVSI